MQKWSKITLFVLLSSWGFQCYAQDDLMDLIDQGEQEREAVISTFNGTRIINGHSVETRKRGTLDVIFMHRFGKINGGVYEFWGLDQAWVRLGAEYALTDRLTAGLGRSSYEKTYDGFLKYKLLDQTTGPSPFPFTGTVFASAAINTTRPTDPEMDVKFSSRLSYTYQVLLARKFNKKLSLQLTPTWVHHNLVETPDQNNDILALGLSGRHKFGKRMALIFEYFYQFNNNTRQTNYNPLGLGLEFETGGHVFQLVFANSQAMIEQQFITETSGDFFGGDIHFGFNIVRAFQLK